MFICVFLKLNLLCFTCMFFTIYLNFFIFFLLNRPVDGSKGTELLSVEVPCQYGELKCELHLVGLKLIGHNRSHFTLPTEMELCAAMELLEVPSSPP